MSFADFSQLRISDPVTKIEMVPNGTGLKNVPTKPIIVKAVTSMV
jgi:hypothetical protein